MGSDGTSLRVNVDDGKATVDGPLKFKDGDAQAGKTPKVVAGAYTNSSNPKPGATALYDIDEGGHLLSQAPPNDLVFASTSAPFFERGHAPLIIHALGLAGATRSLDASGSRRAATSALMRALESDRTALVAAGERRPTDPGSAAQLGFGDGGAAVATARADRPRAMEFVTLARSTARPSRPSGGRRRGAAPASRAACARACARRRRSRCRPAGCWRCSCGPHRSYADRGAR